MTIAESPSCLLAPQYAQPATDTDGCLPEPAVGASIAPTRQDLERTFAHKHGDLSNAGWLPRMQRAFDYFNPDDHYEALVAKLVRPETRWLDVGCGRMVFPSNALLARTLADRCKLLVGLDPSETLDENQFVHRKIRQPIEDFRPDQPFDLVTMRMVAEHISSPGTTLAALTGATHPGSRVVVYTVNKWSPISLISRLVPFGLHHALKQLVWDAEEKDTFPVVYRMNTRRSLTATFGQAGFAELMFAHLDDCRTSGRHRRLRHVELHTRRMLARFGLRYPETCLLAVYERR